MTWDAFHRRGEVLRAVVDEANARRDGVLPMDLPGVAETFGDAPTLVGALQLRWHTRLTGAIERELAEDPADLEAAVIRGWHRAAHDLAGVRAVLDRQAGQASDDAIATMMAKAKRKEWALLGGMAGLANPLDPAVAVAGRRLEERARASYHPAPQPTTVGARRAERDSLISRLRAALAA